MVDISSYGPQQGYGPPQGYGPQQGFPPPKKSNALVIIIVLIVVGGLGLLIAVPMAIYGVRRYLQSAKTSEAKNTLGAIGKAAVAAYERDKALCPSASEAVPKAPPSGRKYQSTDTDWQRDAAGKGGFACLKFSMQNPQYYSYSYTATDAGFIVTARGDLDADGNFSELTLEGKVQNGTAKLADGIKTKDEFE